MTEAPRNISELETAPQILFAQLEERGERPRFWVRDDPPGAGGWRPVTWNELARRVRALALVLAEDGIGKGDAVAVFGDNSVDWAAAALAIQAAGAVMVPIYAASTGDQAGFILGNCQARAVFVDDPDRDLGGAAPPRRYRLGDEGSYRRGDDLHRADPDRMPALLAAATAEDPALMLYTSGTSGDPKGVPLTHGNLAANGADWLEVCEPLLGGSRGEDDADVDVLWLPLSHIFGFGEMCQGNRLGWTTYMETPRTVLASLPEIRPTVFFSVPAYWEKLARLCCEQRDTSACLRDLTGGRLRFALSGGAGLGIEVKERFLAAGILILEGYGLTECSPTLTLNRPGDYRFDSVGKPLPSVELRLAEDGEILARGPNVFSGYDRLPEATAEAFTDDGWFRTGDLGRFTEDGFLQIIGRKKEILVTAGGKNVPPANIELRFADDPTIDHLVVYGDGKKYLVACVWVNPSVPRESREALVAARIAAVNQQLPRYETIKCWTIIDEPLTPDSGLVTASMKLRRQHIYRAFRRQFEDLYGAGQ